MSKFEIKPSEFLGVYCILGERCSDVPVKPNGKIRFLTALHETGNGGTDLCHDVKDSYVG